MKTKIKQKKNVLRRTHTPSFAFLLVFIFLVNLLCLFDSYQRNDADECMIETSISFFVIKRFIINFKKHAFVK